MACGLVDLDFGTCSVGAGLLDLVVHSHNQRLVVNNLHRTDFTIGIPGMFYVLAGKPLFFDKNRERPGKTLLLLHLCHDMWCEYLREKGKSH